MTRILILEGNPPDLLAMGKSDAMPFVASLLAIDPALDLRLANPDAVEIDAARLSDVDGVVFTGSGTAWAADAPEAAAQRAAMRTVLDSGVATWGSCNGLQLAAVVLGGVVGASPNGVECGVALGITMTDAGQDHAMMAGRDTGFGVPCMHRDEVQKLPPGAVLLAGNAHSPVQAMAYAQDGVDFWGVQYHPECSARDVARWLRARGAPQGVLADDLDQADFEDDAAARVGLRPHDLTVAARTRELGNWLAHVKSRERG